MAIQNLPSTDELSTSDAVALFSSLLGSDAKATLGTLLAWLQSQLTDAGGLITQYAAPNATGYNIAVSPAVAGSSVWLLITPTGAFAAGTVTLPAQAQCVDGQEVLVSTTLAVTALTVAGNGSTVNGAPTTLAANAFFKLRFDGVLKVWYRVG